MDIFRTKHPASLPVDSALHCCLTATDLTLMGIGAIIGAGVFILTGVAAATQAGPAVAISYIIAGIAAMLAALSYAELATSVGGCGSAYTYTYAGFGEFIAWMIGWNLLFEYALSVSAVSIGWSSYVNVGLLALNIHLPLALIHNPFEGGIINLPAVLIIAVLGFFLFIGMRESVRFNFIAVVIKLVTIGIFIAVAVGKVNPANWHPFLPFGWQGVIQGSALVFFAYIGFDALSTAAEETIDPQRSLPIGIILSVTICSAIYFLVSILLTGIVHYSTLNVSSPVADAIFNIGYPLVAGLISVGAVAGLTTVMLIMYYGLTRITFAIARDGLLPVMFAKINPQTKTPSTIIVFSGIIIAAVAGFMPLGEAAQLVNIGTLFAFTFVCAGVIFLRISKPDMPRPFHLPFNPLIPLLGIIFCVYLMLHLPSLTWWRFLAWIVLGTIIYFTYSYQHSHLQK
ncbi:MAG: amino acid permease [Gammaproteobacteria bacterium]